MVQAASSDFDSLAHHWNFDEGRDWHMMPQPFHSNENKAHDSVGSIRFALPGKNPDATWASGRQYSGVRLNSGGLTASNNIEALAGTCSLSFWIRMKDTKGYVVGDRKGIVFGVVFPSGRIGLVINGKVALSSKRCITDGAWHHVVFTRNADDGAIQLFLDDKPESRTRGPQGHIKGVYRKLGVSPKGKDFEAVIDQVHIFKSVVNKETVHKLYDNHAPKIYDQECLVDESKPTRTGSILHLYTHDNERDKLTVWRFGQGRHGKVESIGDGTFNYSPHEDFPGRDSFQVEVTDGKGGFCRAQMKVFDSRYATGQVVELYQYCGELPDALPGTSRDGYCKPMSIKLPGRKQVDLLVVSGSRLWYYANESEKGSIRFTNPVEVMDNRGNPLHIEGAAVLQDERLVVRRRDGTLCHAQLLPGKPLRVKIGNELRDSFGRAFRLNERFFVWVDYDLDGVKDLVYGHVWGLYWHRNEGSSDNPELSAKAQCAFAESYNVFPGLGDMDADGRIDLLHGNNWGHLGTWQSRYEGKDIKEQRSRYMLRIENMPSQDTLTSLNGTNPVGEDFDGDGVVDIVVGGSAQHKMICARGIDPNGARRNLKRIEKEIYAGNAHNLGKFLMANEQAQLKKYKKLMSEWVAWAVTQKTPAARAKAFNMLKRHVKKYPFLQRCYLKEAWIKHNPESKQIAAFGAMHLVPGIFTQNWIVLHRLLPDSAGHRTEVADILGMKGTDREVYLATGLPLADNNHCSEGQLLSICDFMLRHPRVLFPDDHLSIDLHFGDGRDAMSYIFVSNKNTFGSEVGSYVNEMHGDMVKATEACLEEPGAANGDYFTLVMAHEVCHSLDAYVMNLPNQDLKRRWADMLIYAGNNGGKANLVAAGKDGWIDTEKTQENFRKAMLWDGKQDWSQFWREYWDKQCSYDDYAFMRGNIGEFLYMRQESLATQANHHWTRSEARLIGAIYRFESGYKSPINEVMHFLDIVSAGMNKIHMYHTVTSHETKKVDFRSDPAWLVRNDQGYITDITFAGRTYSFKVDENGRTVGIHSHPFQKKIKQLVK